MKTLKQNKTLIIGMLLLTSLSTAQANMVPRSLNADVLQAAPDSSQTDMVNTTGRGNYNLIYKLVKLNIKIWGRVGWEYGRYESLKKYGVDIGTYPGASKVTLSYFKKKFG